MNIAAIQAELTKRRKRELLRLESETSEQRLKRAEQLQIAAMKLLHDSPDGLLHFHRRNHHSRRARFIDGVWQPVSDTRPTPPT